MSAAESAPETVTVQAVVAAPPEHVWDAWTDPAAIQQWNAASDDWHCPAATNDLRAGGEFVSRMEAREAFQRSLPPDGAPRLYTRRFYDPWPVEKP